MQSPQAGLGRDRALLDEAARCLAGPRDPRHHPRRRRTHRPAAKRSCGQAPWRRRGKGSPLRTLVALAACVPYRAPILVGGKREFVVRFAATNPG